MKHAAPMRRELGVRTAFNLLGPLTNPAGATRQIVGVPRAELTDLMARSLALLGSRRAWVVHGADGLDELSTTGYTKVAECRDGSVHTFHVHPADFGLPTGAAGGSARAATRRATPRSSPRFLAGRRDRPATSSCSTPGRRCSSPAEPAPSATGLPRPRPAIDSGAARATLDADGAQLARRGGSARARSQREHARPAADNRRGDAPDDRAAPRAGAAGGARAPGRSGIPARRRLRARPRALRRGGPRQAASHATGRPNVIAECKRRSPSRGVLTEYYDPVAIACRYERGGAAAISVLTEPTFFDGALEHLTAVRAAVDDAAAAQGLLVDDYQLFEARAAGADAILLIVAALAQEELTGLQARAWALGLAVLVEVHDEGELARAVDAGARLIGVNNRNLRTLAVDTDASYRLAALMPAGVTAVSESGLKTRAELERLAAAGYQAFLIGERFMTDPDPALAIAELIGGGWADLKVRRHVTPT